MRGNALVCLTAAGLIAAAGTWAQSRAAESPEQNVRASQQYERLLCTSRAFRERRIAIECGPIEDPELHQSCVASFHCGKPHRAPHWRKAPPSETIR